MISKSKATELPTIVSAFYDINRSEWFKDSSKNWLNRSNSVYIYNFLILCFLKNDIVLYVDPNLYKKVRNSLKIIPKKNIKVISYSIDKLARERLPDIANVQNSPEFKAKIPSDNKVCPETWNPKYVLVTNLKVFFMHQAIKDKLVHTKTIAWIDFGYCRGPHALPSSLRWQPPVLQNEKNVQLLATKSYSGKNLFDCIYENDVYIGGAMILTDASNVSWLNTLFNIKRNSLLDNNIVDDDQGILLACYLHDKNRFVLHKIPDWQDDCNVDALVALKTNNSVSEQLGSFKSLLIKFICKLSVFISKYC